MIPLSRLYNNRAIHMPLNEYPILCNYESRRDVEKVLTSVALPPLSSYTISAKIRAKEWLVRPLNNQCYMLPEVYNIDITLEKLFWL